MASFSRTFTDSQLADIIRLKDTGSTYSDVAAYIAKHYGLEASSYAVQRAYLKYRHIFDLTDSKINIKTLKEVARVKRANSATAKQNRVVLDALNEQQDVLEQVKLAVAASSKIKVAKPKPPKRDKTKPAMTVEVQISDVHIGKLTDTFDLEVCRARLRQLALLVIDEVKRKSAHYDVERLIILFGGDEIENATMHGIESMRGCEFANPEQIRFAIELFLEEILLPLAALGIPADVLCVTGNHSREGEKKTYQQPGKNSFTWVIFHALKLLCDRAGLSHLKWTIPEGPYTVYQVYGTNILLEHGDNFGGDKKAFLGHMAKRSAQLGILIMGIRVGHWHSASVYDNGRVVVNGSVCGGDSFADVLGFTSIPMQMVTFYVRTENRDTPYYYSLPVYLTAGDKK